MNHFRFPCSGVLADLKVLRKLLLPYFEETQNEEVVILGDNRFTDFKDWFLLTETDPTRWRDCPITNVTLKPGAGHRERVSKNSNQEHGTLVSGRSPSLKFDGSGHTFHDPANDGGSGNAVRLEVGKQGRGLVFGERNEEAS